MCSISAKPVSQGLERLSNGWMWLVKSTFRVRARMHGLQDVRGLQAICMCIYIYIVDCNWMDWWKVLLRGLPLFRDLCNPQSQPWKWIPMFQHRFSMTWREGMNLRCWVEAWCHIFDALDDTKQFGRTYTLLWTLKTLTDWTPPETGWISLSINQ